VARPLTAADLVAELGRNFYSERLREETALLGAAHQQEMNRLRQVLLIGRLRDEESLLASAHRREAARLGRQLRSRASGKRRVGPKR
jgi:hypothetical protein